MLHSPKSYKSCDDTSSFIGEILSDYREKTVKKSTRIFTDFSPNLSTVWTISKTEERLVCMKKSRQLHLWIGLICSILILIEAITGLLLSEPWLIGVQGRGEIRGEMRFEQQAAPSDQTSSSTAPTDSVSQNPVVASSERPSEFQPDTRKAQNSLMMLVRQLHEGRIGSTNLKWLADVAAIGLIILTVTGITLSMKTLRAQRIRHKKLASASDDSEEIHF